MALESTASNKNEYQEYFLGGKSRQCLGLTTLSPSCGDCLEPSGSVQAPTGIALPLPLPCSMKVAVQ